MTSTSPILACKGCGRTKPGPTGDPTDLFPSEHCGDCPPWTCEDCGEACSAASLCSCWVRLDTLPLADVKAVFAADGTFSVDPT
ncbi:hypothetical protein ACFC08_00065 [Streptomyces sp. NPDC056112]|uniref:hypothetical protein n=1 Tax=Streptomyces sp. NPDC056112 TaxID=3345715 RepID=UPI0035D8D784